MSVNVAVTEKVPLFLNVGDGNAQLFVRAKVVNEQGNELSQSPITMYNEGNGQYSYNDLVMPDLSFINAVYDIFSDSAFLKPARYYSVTETFVASNNTDNSDLGQACIDVEVEVETEEIDIIVTRKK